MYVFAVSLCFSRSLLMWFHIYGLTDFPVGVCEHTEKKLNRPCVCQQGAYGGCNGVHTFMSVGNSSFFTKPVAATMFPMAPVVFSATA